MIILVIVGLFVISSASPSDSSPSSSSFSSDSDEEGLQMESISLVPLFHRYIETYNDECIGNLTDAEQAIIEAQIAFDTINDIYAPIRDDGEDAPYEYTPLGTLEIGQLIHSGDESAIFSIVQRPDLLIKYQANCDEIVPGTHYLHPLILDFWYMRESFFHGLSPEPIFLSPPVLFRDMYELVGYRKLVFDMNVFAAADCALDGGVVRYLIMQRAPGMSLYQFRKTFRNNIVPMGIAAAITEKVVEGLSRLHQEAQIVHGDIHTGNIMVLKREDGQYEIQFIDFGRAFRDDRQLTTDRVFPVGYWNHFLCSPWQIDGRAWSRRDDVYKAIHGFANLINPFQYKAREEALMAERGLQGSIELKLTRFMFQMPPVVTANNTRLTFIPSSYDPIEAETRSDLERREYLMSELMSLQECVTTALENINEDIRYTEIVTSLQWVQAIILGDDDIVSRVSV